MRRGLILLFFACFAAMTCTTVYADPIPDEVMKPYKASLAALEAKDIKLAAGQAETAWQQAETLLGDSKATGDLAYNYGLLALRVSDLKSAAKALERSADLAKQNGKDGALSSLERESSLIIVLLALNKRTKAHSRIDAALKLAEANDIDDTVFAGEIMVNKARLIAGRANSKAKNSTSLLATRMNNSGKRAPANRMQWRSAKYAQEAINIFEKNPDMAHKKFSAIAYKLIGFSHERDKEWLEATLAYQKAMALNAQIMKREDKASITTIGRWTNTRMHLLSSMDKDEAYEKGLCDDCWPYDGAKSGVKYITKPIKRVPPRMPSRASTSGFSFMRFDLDDAGKPINIQILHSWPEKMYDKSSVAAVKRWRYTPRVPEETDAQRKNIRTDIRYILTDYYGNDPI
ncbi:MAG: energy transducer TonB [Robiginitomaculum sp.]|nr:energy transducer TonB [Robiginitomaculum sp.]